MPIKPDELRELATKIRSLANATQPLKERLEAAGGLISSALDAGAFSTSDFGALAAHNCRSRLQQKAKDRTAVWAAVVSLLKSTLGCPPDPDAAIADDGESDSLPDPGATFPDDCEMVATQILASLEQVARRNAAMLDDVKLALADMVGRELIDERVWQIAVALPCPAEGEVTIDVRVFDGNAELDPPNDELNRGAWEDLQLRYGQGLQIRLDQGVPVVALENGTPIRGQRADSRGTGLAVSPNDPLDWLARRTYVPTKLTGDQVDRLRAHLTATANALRTSADRARWARLKEILDANELRRVQTSGRQMEAEDSGGYSSKPTMPARRCRPEMGACGPFGSATAGDEPEAATPDRHGYVASPADPSVYAPASNILTEHTPPDAAISMDQLTAIVEDYEKNHIRWTRPLAKNGRPKKSRRSVHLGDWAAYLKRRAPAEADGFPRLTEAEMEHRKAAARGSKRAEK